MHIGFESDLYNIAHNITRIPSGSCLIHSHTTYELLYALSGDATFSIGGTEYTLRPHTLLCIPPNVFHGIHVHTEEPYDRYTVHFDPAILSHEHRALLLSKLPDKTDSCCLYDMENSGILDMLRQFDDLDSEPESLQRPLIPIFLQALIARILMTLPSEDGISSKPEASARRLMRKNLLRYVDEHFTESIKLDALSARFYVSKSQLNQTFRQMTGTTVIDYIIRKRIAYAQQLLLNGVSAAQAGAAAGFGDYTSFYRAYKKHFGCSPSYDKHEVTHNGRIPEESNSYLSEGFSLTLEERKQKGTSPRE